MKHAWWMALVIAGCATTPTAKPAPAATDQLPAIALTTPTGQTRLLDEARGGRAALVNFWATWCDSCVAELPALARLAAQAPSVGAVVLGVDVGEPHGKVAAYLDAHPLGYASLVDEEFLLADAAGSRRVPTTLVIDRTGRIVYRTGALDQGALDALAAASRN